MLSEFPYKSIANDPTNKYEKSVKGVTQQLLNSNKITKNMHNWLNIQNSGCHRFYGAPKIHKPDILLRPIVNFRSTGYNLACYVHKILHPIIRKREHFIINSEVFVSKLRSMKLKRGFCIVSFDVVSLFTKTPIQTTLGLIETRLLEDTDCKTKGFLEISDILMLQETWPIPRSINGKFFLMEWQFL